MNKRFYEIKGIAKEKMRGHFGTTLMIVFIPPIVYGIIAAIVGSIFSIISVDLGNLADGIITSYGTFISLSLIVLFFKGRKNFKSEDFFFYDNRVLQYFLLSLILFVLGFIVLLPYYNQIQSLTTVPLSMISDYSAYVDAIISDITPVQVIASLILTLISVYIGVRLMFAPYIIVDQHKKVMEAIKQSWDYTRGKFWYLLFFPLSFILWFLLIIPTLFLILIYLIPYISLSMAALYFEFKKANGDEEVVVEEREEVIEVDILDDDIY